MSFSAGFKGSLGRDGGVRLKSVAECGLWEAHIGLSLEGLCNFWVGWKQTKKKNEKQKQNKQKKENKKKTKQKQLTSMFS